MECSLFRTFWRRTWLRWFEHAIPPGRVESHVHPREYYHHSTDELIYWPHLGILEIPLARFLSWALQVLEHIETRHLGGRYLEIAEEAALSDQLAFSEGGKVPGVRDRTKMYDRIKLDNTMYNSPGFSLRNHPTWASIDQARKVDSESF